MVALNRNYPFTDYPFVPLPEDILAQVVDLRARGKSWEETAQAIEWDLADLRRGVRHDPNYAAAYALAEREVQQEADAEGMAKLRVLLTDKKPRIALDAAKIITRYLSERRREETHLEVERMRAEARAARAVAQPAEAEAEEQPTPADREAKYLADRERRNAGYLAREGKLVYLWGGVHPLGGVAPDATDTPLYLRVELPPGQGERYWALSAATVTDPPFVITQPTDAPPG